MLYASLSFTFTFTYWGRERKRAFLIELLFRAEPIAKNPKKWFNCEGNSCSRNITFFAYDVTGKREAKQNEMEHTRVSLQRVYKNSILKAWAVVTREIYTLKQRDIYLNSYRIGGQFTKLICALHSYSSVWQSIKQIPYFPCWIHTCSSGTVDSARSIWHLFLVHCIGKLNFVVLFPVCMRWNTATPQSSIEH